MKLIFLKHNSLLKTFHFFSLCLSCCFILGGKLMGQTYTPLYYWNFDTPTPLLDLQQNRPWIDEQHSSLKKDGGLRGNYFYFDNQFQGKVSMPVELTHDLSIEFWIKPDPDHFKKGQMFFFFNDRKASITFSFPKFQFTTLTKTAQGKVVMHNLVFELDGQGKKSLDYFLNNSWHHFVFQYQVSKGIKEIWIDGELLPGMRTTEAPKGILCATNGNCKAKFLLFNQAAGPNSANYVGGLDEIALYNKSLPPPLIVQHYNEIKSGKHYSFQVQKSRKIEGPEASETIEQSSPISMQTVDLREFPPKHPRVRLSAIEQLRLYPLPRFKQGHQLNRNINWMALDYFGGFKRKGLTPDMAKNAAAIQEELALNWNYYLMVKGTRSAKKDAQGNLSTITTELIKLANKYPQIPLSVITFWAQVVPRDLGLEEAAPRILQKHQQYTIRNTKKQALDAAGREGTNKFALSPRMPSKLIQSDGKIQARYMQNLLEKLNRPIDLINENGEVPFLPYPISTLEKDPEIVKHKNKLGIKDWDTYQALQKNRLRMAYSKEFLKNPALKNTRFTWYGVDAGPADRFEWKSARLIHTKVNGQYYSTPDFYVRWPYNWFKVQGPWRGWSWIEDSRKVEIQTGDKLFSPFVAAGWDADPEKNVRPSQWLGLLKCLGPIGAEYFYTGYFNVNRAVSNPADYAWQAVYPVYAQAITSQYESLFRKGNVLMDPTSTPIIRLSTGDPRILATVRKYGKQYILALTIQPQSNIKGNVPDEVAVKLNFEGLEINCRARRQGSVYFMDITKAQAPVFYQLDAWHQSGHPSRWSKDFAFEAEVFDYSMEQEIRTERKAGAAQGDFREFDTYLRATGTKACSKYHFHPRENNSSYQLRIRARSRSGNRGTLPVILDGVELGEIKNIKAGAWQWYELPAKIKNLKAKEHMLSLLQADGKVEIDKFVLQAK